MTGEEDIESYSRVNGLLQGNFNSPSRGRFRSAFPSTPKNLPRPLPITLMSGLRAERGCGAGSGVFVSGLFSPGICAGGMGGSCDFSCFSASGCWTCPNANGGADAADANKPYGN